MTSYTEALAQSMQRTKELVTKKMLRDLLYGERVKGANEYIHGAEDGLRKQTETVQERVPTGTR